MKPHKIILSIVFAVYFLFAGTGFNIISYCCNTCAQHGVEAIVVQKLSAIKHADEQNCCQTEEPEHKACSDKHPDFTQTDNCCGIKRLSVDTPSHEIKIFQTDNRQLDLFGYCCVESNLFDYRALLLCRKLAIVDPPPCELLLTGRDILAFHSVLLI